ncbi:MAG: hypothetical protein IJ129_07080 [Ruminococcus sp.]|nr:hypothetical protein [Ruminococcus sp.]
MKTKAIKKGFARLICAVLAFSLAASVMLPTAYADSEADTADVTIDGEKADVKTGGDWVSYDIQGSDEPTAAAPAGSFFGPAKGVNIQNLGVKNLYTLTVSTGINNGSCVEYFAVRYKDNDNVAQTKYLFPRTHALKATYDFIREAAGGKIGDNTISGLSAIGDLSTAYDSKTRILSNLGYQRKTPDDLIALRAMSVDEYLFMADNGISEVTGIEAFMSKGQWTVQGMSVSHVTEIGGYNEYGFYSGRYFLSLGKQKIAELSKKSSGVMTLTATGDTLINVGGKSSSYYDLKTVNKTIDCPTGDLYTFRIDITDKIDSGLESLIRNNSADSDPASGKVVEDLALEVQYIDKNGWTRIVTMPVLLSVIGQNKLLGDKVATIGLGQRGDTLAFTGYLPEYQSLATTRLYVGSAARSRLEVTGGINTPEGRKLLDEQATVKQRIDQGNINVSEEKYMKPFRDAYATRMAPATALEEDYLSVSGVSLFKGTCRMTNTPAGTDTVTNQSVPSLTLAYAYESQYPLYYFTTTVETGFRINPGTSDTFDMRTYVSGDPIGATGMKGDLLVRLKTGDSYGSGTTGNILFTMTYMDHQGRTATTRRYDVKQEVNDYLGYWPSAEGINGDYAYLYGASASNYLEFPVTVSDIAAVISVDISLDGYSTDEWVLEGIAVYVLDDIGRRQVYAQDSELGTDNEGSDRSTYRIVRPTKKTLLEPFPFTLDKLVTPGDHVPLDIGKGTVTPYQEVDFNSMRYSMTHEQTMLDLGFVNRKKIYDIDVKVAGDTAVLTENGDSGSNNRFYFQLEFRNGTTSAYVLANQQLGSDGFRSGYSERFSICVNRDYSDVSKIRIIPEDVSEDSEIFDKLNIEQISITERAYGGSSTQWVVDQVGWIGIDYRDSAELNAIKQDKGRSAGLIAKEYRVSYQRNVTNLLCEVLTLPWDTDYQQVQGSISCDLEYIDTNGQPQTTSFDVVRAMAEYMKKTPITYETYENGSFDNSYTNLGSVSDPKWMLRPNHCDRFMLPPLANVKSLKSMTFHATSRNNKPAKWVIGDVSISRVLIDDDSVELTKMGEYYRSMQTEPYCSAVSDKANNTLLLPAGMTETLTLELSDNEVTWAEDKSWAASVTSLPDTMNDTMNIYIYPDPDMPDIEGAVVKVAAMYTVPFSKMEQKREAAMRTYGSGTKDAVFYAEGIKADGMKNLNLLGLQ